MYMEFKLNPSYRIDKDIFTKKEKIINNIKELNDLYLNEIYHGNKVAYYYENINTGDIISFNDEICFYAASTIKTLVCMIIYNDASRGLIDLNQELLITMDELNQGSGVIKYQEKDTKYTIRELIKLTIVESDNSAYIKLVKFVGKDRIKEFGASLGAMHTLETIKNDSFGITNCKDMILYWKEIKNFIDNSTFGDEFKEYLVNPTVKYVTDSTLDGYQFIRKYGSCDIACHETGYIDNECYIIILTQLNNFDYKEEFINKTCKELIKIHREL